MAITTSSFWLLLKQTVMEWHRDKVSRLAAALAYYATFSLAPVLIIAIAIASFVFEQSAVQARVIAQLQETLGESGAALVRTVLTNKAQTEGSMLATFVSVGLLCLGASGLFIQLQVALDTVWNVVPRKNVGWVKLLRDRLISFGMVLVVGILLFVSLLVSSIVSGVSGFLSEMIVGLGIGLQVIDTVLSFGITMLAFALIYKVLPNVKVAWGDVWVGAATTALLFTIGKFLISFYLSSSTVASAYGAAGSLVVLLLWIYYSAQIFLFGAEFTQVYAGRFGSDIRPDKYAQDAPAVALSDKHLAERQPKAAASQNLSQSATYSGQLEHQLEQHMPKTRSEYRAMKERSLRKQSNKCRNKSD